VLYPFSTTAHFTTAKKELYLWHHIWRKKYDRKIHGPPETLVDDDEGEEGFAYWACCDEPEPEPTEEELLFDSDEEFDYTD
jgi:hypothetical protein